MIQRKSNTCRRRLQAWYVLAGALLLLTGSAGMRPALAGPPIGINIGQIEDWDSELLFADAVKQSRGWFDLNNNVLTNVDANGWPQQDARAGMWFGASASPKNMAGTYGLSFNGKAVLSIVSGATAGHGAFSNQVYNSGTNTTTVTLVMTDSGDLNIEFDSTQRTSGSALNTGVTNFKMMRPTVPTGSTPYATNVTFTTQEKALVAKFGVLRFMKYAGTWGSTMTSWSQRGLPGAVTQQTDFNSVVGGGAWEYAVQLCNETNTDLWVNIPHLCGDDYSTKLAQLIKFGSDGVNPYTSTQANPVWPPLNANLNVYVEWGNEVWNWALSDATDNLNSANAEVAAYPIVNGFHLGPLNFDNGNEGGSFLQRVVKRSVEVSNAFRAVFGDSAMPGTSANPRVRPVYEWQFGGGGSVGAHMLEDYYNSPVNLAAVAAAIPGSPTVAHPPTYYFYGGGGAPYYSVAAPPFDINSIWTLGEFNTANWTPYIHADVDVAASLFGRDIAYEGGPDMPTLNDGYDAIRSQAWGDSRMTTAVTNHQTAWNQSGGGLQVYFQSVGDYQWGFTHDNSVLNTPKLLGIDQINASTQAVSTYGTAIPGTIVPPGQSDQLQPNPNNMDANASGIEFVGTSVLVSTAGQFNIALNAGSVGTGNQADIYMDGVLAGTINIGNTGSKTTFALTGTVSTPSLTVGTHGLIVKAKTGAFGYGSVVITAGGGAVLPSAPTGLSATSGNAQVALSWTAPSTGTQPFTYNVYRGTTAGGESSTAITTGLSTTAFTNTGLTNGTTYFYKVAAVNAAGTGPQSSEASATPTSGSGGTPVLQINCGGSAASPYIADADFTGGSTYSDPTTVNTAGVTNPAPQAVYQSERYCLNNQSFTYTLPGLTANASYTVRLHFNAFGGTIVDNVTINGTQVLTNFNVGTAAGGSYIAIVQSFSATADSTGKITIVFSNPGTGQYASIQGIEVLTAGGSAPAAPTGLTATPGSAQVALSWTASSGATSYNVYRGTTAGGESGTAIATGIAVTNYTNTGLTNGTHYYYTVKAVNASGTSGASNEANATPVAVPAAPTGLAATPGNTQVALTWTASSGATSYNVYRGTTAGGESTTAIATGIAVTNYTNTGLTNGTHYYFTVKAVNGSGTSGASNEANATPVVGNTPVLQINCGGAAASPYVADVDFTGGTTYTVTYAVNTSGVTNPAPLAVYQSERYCGLNQSFTYTLPGLTANAAYTVRLHFNAFDGIIIDNVTINGTRVLTNFNVATAAGGNNIAITQSFAATADSTGKITIVFANPGTGTYAAIQGIEVLH